MNSNERRVNILIEMRPALDGFAGIPQEVRLLFRGLKTIPTNEVQGLIQTHTTTLSPGTKKKTLFSKTLTTDQKYNKYSRVIISLAEKPYKNSFERALGYFGRRFHSSRLLLEAYLHIRMIELTDFKAESFEDFTWQTLFSKTLPASDLSLVAKSNHKICCTPWQTLHMVGLKSINFSDTPNYPKIDTQGFDIFIGQTPYPGRVRKGTTLVIRYHDALPILMPHTISDKSLHQATHYYALKFNIKSGAWFSCVSESTRQDLIRLFPEVEKRSITIHNMVSHHYFPDNSAWNRVPNIIRSRQHSSSEDETKEYGLIPSFLSLREKESFYRRNLYQNRFNYLLIVSTIEPRKNHSRLLAAWEALKADIDPDLKLIVVGTLGWSYKKIVKGFQSHIDRGDIFLLSSVPSPDLRVLYKHAAATVCPSLGEGFDFSGVESMASGGITIASNIPVHREIYEDAAVYFDPYTTMSLVNTIKSTLYSTNSNKIKNTLIEKGKIVSSKYQPAIILPRWEYFIKNIIK